MKVNIVLRELWDNNDPTRILPRMAQILSDGTGWPITVEPNLKADINYFMAYRYRPLVTSPFAAYFFHLYVRPGHPEDAKLWNEAAPLAKLRIATARQYEQLLTPFGPTALVLPPLDRKKFALRRRATHAVAPMVAGVGGYVPPDGRKGDRMLAELVRKPVGLKFEWRASGKGVGCPGWPVPTRLLKLDELPDFYHGLDVFVCTSISEGVPYPPLEALACGIPIVIPRGVGLLDDLPDIPGIVRYKAGDVRDLHHVMQIFMDGWPEDVDRQALRDATKPYTEQAWIRGHVDAFARLDLGPPPTVSVILLTASPISAHTQECLAALSRSSIPYELILVQNQVGWTFAGRVNQGLRAATGECILLLNDDCFVEPLTLETLARACQQKDVGIVGGVLTQRNGAIQHSGGFINRTNDRWEMGNSTSRPPAGQQDCEFVTGALLMIRRSVVDKIGALDEGFSSYYEDVDWCLRAKKAGYRVIVDPRAKAIHLAAQTMNEDRVTFASRFKESRAYFRSKYGH